MIATQILPYQKRQIFVIKACQNYCLENFWPGSIFIFIFIFCGISLLNKAAQYNWAVSFLREMLTDKCIVYCAAKNNHTIIFQSDFTMKNQTHMVFPTGGKHGSYRVCQLFWKPCTPTQVYWHWSDHSKHGGISYFPATLYQWQVRVHRFQKQ